MYSIMANSLRLLKSKYMEMKFHEKSEKFETNPLKAMDPLFVLVCSCFRENVILTCKIVSFLCSLDNFLLKNVIVFFFGNKVSKWHSFAKKSYFDLFFTMFSHQGEDAKIPSAHISLTYTHTYFAHNIDLFALPILQKYEFIM